MSQLPHYRVNNKPHYGCKLNKAFETQLGIKHMMVHAKQLEFNNTISGDKSELL